MRKRRKGGHTTITSPGGEEDGGEDHFTFKCFKKHNTEKMFLRFGKLGERIASGSGGQY